VQPPHLALLTLPLLAPANGPGHANPRFSSLARSRCPAAPNGKIRPAQDSPNRQRHLQWASSSSSGSTTSRRRRCRRSSTSHPTKSPGGGRCPPQSARSPAMLLPVMPAMANISRRRAMHHHRVHHHRLVSTAQHSTIHPTPLCNGRACTALGVTICAACALCRCVWGLHHR
jgi:hypothetical protein